MNEKNTIAIHETAFLTSTLRSLNERLSMDIYAKLWNNPKTDRWVEKYLDEITYSEITAHGFRNRFFYNHINELFKNNEIELFINFGSGFSMYPFLLESNLIYVEIDKPEIIEYKKEKIEIWQKEGVLPRRDIHFIGVDFSEYYQDSLAKEINAIKGNKRCFILLEGVLYFLNYIEASLLFSFFEEIQNKGDFIGSVSFQSTIKDTEGYNKLLKYLSKGVVKNRADEFLTLGNEFYLKRKKYFLIDHQDYFSLSNEYNESLKFDKDLILNENYYLLKRVRQ